MGRQLLEKQKKHKEEHEEARLELEELNRQAGSGRVQEMRRCQDDLCTCRISPYLKGSPISGQGRRESLVGSYPNRVRT